MAAHDRLTPRRGQDQVTSAAAEPAVPTPDADLGFRPAGPGGELTTRDSPDGGPGQDAMHWAALRRSAVDTEQTGLAAPTSPVPDVLRRVILDPGAEEDVFDIAAGKRDAEVANLSMDWLVGGQDHSALEQFIGARQAKGQQQRPMAELRATRKGADKKIRETVRSDLGQLRSQRLVKPKRGPTGLEQKPDRTGLEQTLGTKVGRGSDFDPAQHVKDERRERRNKRRATARDGYNGELAKQNRAAVLEIQQAKETVQSKSKTMSTVLKQGRSAVGTDHEPFEMVQLSTALDAKNWKEALAALNQVETASNAALDNARHRLDARTPDIANVDKHPAYHRPTDLDDRRKALGAAMDNQEWPTIATQVTDFLAIIDLALSFQSRLASVEAETDNLTNLGRKTFMTGEIAEHKKLTWEQARDTAESSSKPALAFLETRLETYQNLDIEHAANEVASKEKESAATKDALEKKQAARKLRKERMDKGLLSGNGTVIAERKVTALTGTDEQAAVNKTLDAIKGNTVPVLTHNNGKRWAYPHDNRDGDLPGARGSGGYLEYYVEKDPVSPTYHGDRRVVIHQATKRKYYSWTHYGQNGSPAFVLITE